MACWNYDTHGCVFLAKYLAGGTDNYKNKYLLRANRQQFRLYHNDYLLMIIAMAIAAHLHTAAMCDIFTMNTIALIQLGYYI